VGSRPRASWSRGVRRLGETGGGSAAAGEGIGNLDEENPRL